MDAAARYTPAIGHSGKIAVFHPCGLEYYLDSIHYDAEFEEL
jgi:hypothetical protein